MVIQNIHNPKVKQEVSKQEWESLGARQKLFKIIDANDSDIVRQNVISNDIGKKKTEPAKPVKAGIKK